MTASDVFRLKMNLFFEYPLKKALLTNFYFCFSVKSTGGGTLSVKRYENGSYDIFFSYSDRVDEISATDFCNIVPNFIETAARLKGKFYGTPQEQRQVPSTPVSQETLCLGGMLAKTL